MITEIFAILDFLAKGRLMPTLSLSSMRQWIQTHQEEWLKDYIAFLSIPSVSSEASYQKEMDRCARWLIDTLKSLHFHVEMWPTGRHPVIFASNLDAGPDKPTLLIYNHYDVQPPDPLEAWDTPPFEPSIRDGSVYARGAQDNKGQCFYVLQALKLLLDCKGKLPINIKLCIEGEEEIGSAGLAEILTEKKEQLSADYLAIVDLGLQRPDVPALTLGMRGIVTMDVTLQGSRTDLHSGSHGGIVINPIHALVELLATLRDESGRVAVLGFYDDVVEMSKEEISHIHFDFDIKEYKKQTGAEPFGGEKKYSVLERAWLRPTLEINGISGGYTGDGFKTVIPAQARAKISCRLTSDQDPEKIGELIAAHLRRNTPSGISIVVNVHPGTGRAVRVSPEAAVVKAFAKSFEEVFGKPCTFILEGASIPITAKLSAACGGETLLLGLGLTTDQIHAPNEHFSLDRLEKGMLIMALAIEQLGQ